MNLSIYSNNPTTAFCGPTRFSNAAKLGAVKKLSPAQDLIMSSVHRAENTARKAEDVAKMAVEKSTGKTQGQVNTLFPPSCPGITPPYIMDNTMQEVPIRIEYCIP